MAALAENYPVIEIELDRIDNHTSNYNIHPPAQIDQLAASLQAFGYVKLAVVQPQPGGSRYTLLAGEGIVTAARKIGRRILPFTVVPEDWDAAKAAAYLIADNELARQSRPNLDKLLEIANELQAAGGSLATAAGLTYNRLETLKKMIASQNDAPGTDYGDPKIPEDDRYYWPTFMLTVDDPAAAALYQELSQEAPATSESDKLMQIIKAVNAAALSRR